MNNLRVLECFLSPFRMLLLLSFTALTMTSTFASTTIKEPRTGILFEPKVQGKQLQKLGVRTKGPIKVYAVGQYGSDLFVLKMNISVNAEKMSQALIDALKPRCLEFNCADGQVEAFHDYVLQALPTNGAPKGTTLVFNTGGTFNNNNKVTLSVNGKSAKGHVKGKAIAKAFKAIYTDKKAVCRLKPTKTTKNSDDDDNNKKDTKMTKTNNINISNTNKDPEAMATTLGILAATTVLLILFITKPGKSPRISELFIYPIKSCAEQSVEQVVVTPHGLEGDRTAMVVDKSGNCCTARDKDKAKLFHVRPVLDTQNHTLHVTTMAGSGLKSSSDNDPLVIDLTTATITTPSKAVTHNEAPGTLRLHDYGNTAATWLENMTGIPGCRLMGMGPFYTRQVQINPGQQEQVPVPDAPVSLADEAPLLLTNEESLADLNRRLKARNKAPIDMRRFRPNIVLQAGHDKARAWEEDTWHKIRINTVEFFVWQQCGRCIMTTIDRDTLARTGNGGEPLTTLNEFRENEHGQRNFGVHLIPDPASLQDADDDEFGNDVVAKKYASLVQVGDKVEVLEYNTKRRREWEEKFGY